jgi:hypothetical protein
VRSERVAGKRHSRDFETVEQRVEIRERSRGAYEVRIAQRTRAASPLVVVDQLSTIGEKVEPGRPQVCMAKPGGLRA